MRIRVGIGALVVGLAVQAQEPEQAARDSSAAYWERIERDYADPERSPLAAADREAFTGLERYAYDPAYRVEAVFNVAKRPRIFKMRTTTSREPLYRPYGTLHFTLNGVEEVLTVYESVSRIPGYEDHLFLPFTDATNGEETYGGGRYLDLRSPLGERVMIDFNNAYNPYCAYNAAYSCPVPPRENALTVAVSAGVKAPPED